MAAVPTATATGMEFSRTRNRSNEAGTITVTAADTIPTRMNKVLWASMSNASTGVAVALTWSGSTLTVGSGPSATSCNLFVMGY